MNGGIAALPDPLDPAFAQSFGDWLIRQGLIDGTTRGRALRACERTDERFDRVLIKLGLVRETDLSSALARYLELPLVAPGEFPRQALLLETLSVDFVRQNQILPLSVSTDVLTVAVSDPFVHEQISALSYLTGLKVETRVATATNLEKAIQTLYAVHAGDRGELHSAASGGEANDVDLQRLRDIASEAPIIRLVNGIIADAVEGRASDIHIEPREVDLQVRYRIDGVLLLAQTIEPKLRAAVTSRIKIMAKLDIAERRLPQDGRFRMAIRGVDIDLRVSTLATSHGEGLVLRVLDRSRVELDFAKLGFSDAHVDELRRIMHRPNGIILVTGPTGSGKTTTLYTAMREMNSAESKIFTVEDPVEYQLAGVNQVQVQPQIGLTFPHALRSILRQDPDVIMIGEIRDFETARIAIQAALTGHLVLSTLHTNSAAATITRLVDMGIEAYLLASTLNGILAQRLVRRLCPLCAKPHRAARHWAARLLDDVAGAGTTTAPQLKEPGGCEACRGTGYSGRATVSELIVIDGEMHQLVLSAASDSAIAETARRHGIPSMYQDGVLKAWRGETTIEEVLRVTTTTS